MFYIFTMVFKQVTHLVFWLSDKKNNHHGVNGIGFNKKKMLAMLGFKIVMFFSYDFG